MFGAVTDHQEEEGGVSGLGGRSMGARAAVMAANSKDGGMNHLVLVSYPLENGKGIRDEILLGIGEGVKVRDFMTCFDREDHLCDTEYACLGTVRKWRL